MCCALVKDMLCTGFNEIQFNNAENIKNNDEQLDLIIYVQLLQAKTCPAFNFYLCSLNSERFNQS